MRPLRRMIALRPGLMSPGEIASRLPRWLIFQYQMKSQHSSLFVGFIICFTFVARMDAQQSPAERVAEIQAALREAKLDGWLFYDFRHSDPLAYRILKLDEKMFASRRWFYYVPASGEPVKIVQSIEQFKLDSLPGRKVVFRGWQELHAGLKEVLGATGKESRRRVAMQYSPMNDIPYISRVDAGTIELVRSFGVEPVTSAELVQRFEAVFSPEQHQMHVEASDKMHRIIQDAFAEIARRIRADEPTTEWDIAQFMLRRYKGEGMEQEPMIVAVNANAANPHYMPTKEKNSPIKRGDFVLIDAATKLSKPDAVATDQTWTGYVGESVPEEYSRIFNIVREARDSAVDFVRKNIRAGKSIRRAEVDDVSRGVITRTGFGEQFTHRTGHSIGEETHGNGVNIDDFETRDSRRIIREVVFPSSREFTSKENLAFDRRSTFTCRTKTSKSPGNRFKRRLFRSLRLGDG